MFARLSSLLDREHLHQAVERVLQAGPAHVLRGAGGRRRAEHADRVDQQRHERGGTGAGQVAAGVQKERRLLPALRQVPADPVLPARALRDLLHTWLLSPVALVDLLVLLSGTPQQAQYPPLPDHPANPSEHLPVPRQRTEADGVSRQNRDQSEPVGAHSGQSSDPDSLANPIQGAEEEGFLQRLRPARRRRREQKTKQITGQAVSVHERAVPIDLLSQLCNGASVQVPSVQCENNRKAQRIEASPEGANKRLFARVRQRRGMAAVLFRVCRAGGQDR